MRRRENLAKLKFTRKYLTGKYSASHDEQQKSLLTQDALYSQATRMAKYWSSTHFATFSTLRLIGTWSKIELVVENRMQHQQCWRLLSSLNQPTIRCNNAKHILLTTRDNVVLHLVFSTASDFWPCVKENCNCQTSIDIKTYFIQA